MSERGAGTVAREPIARGAARPSTRRRPRAILGRLGTAARRVPRAAWGCALIACLNAACWSLITPPFQVMNEPSHFAYVQYLAETGHLPTSNSLSYAPDEEIALEDVKQEQVRYSPQVHPIFTERQQRSLEHDLALPLPRIDSAAGFAAAEPPLYYALETLPYYAGTNGTILDRLALMRLFSALTAGVTALFVFLFLREALPSTPWAWSIGGLGVAFAPLLALMSGAVNPDALLCALSSVLFYCLARGFHRGLTPPLAIASGAVIAAGLLTKLNFIGLLPGALLGLLLIAARTRRTAGRSAYRSLALALASAAAPVGLYVVVNLLSGRHAYGTLSPGVSSTAGRGSVLREIGYIWQFYLPRLPGTHAYFPGLSTTRQLWIDGFVGLYGWIDTVFPAWVYSAALVPLALLAILLGRALLVSRRQLRERLPELVVYTTIALGLMILIGASDYLELPGGIGSYAQPRYLLPLIAIYGAALALAARGAGRRWGPVVGVLIVGLLIAHDVFSQLLEISRFYG